MSEQTPKKNWFAAPGHTPEPKNKPSPPPAPIAPNAPFPAPPPPIARVKPPAAPKRSTNFVFSEDTPPATRGVSVSAPTVALPGVGSQGTLGPLSLHTSIPTQDLGGEKMLMPAPRTRIEEKFIPTLGGIPLVAKLGQGGMGAVYLGVDPQTQGEVAVKVLPFHLADRDPVMIERFFREAKMSMAVNSPNVVKVSDAREENGLCYIVMEFVAGASAGGLLKKYKGGRLTEADALEICIAATKGLIAAHKAGIIHRDIKPDNILIPQGSAPGSFDLKAGKLADLGLARTEEHGNSLTQSQTAMGTPGYLAPEQAMDARKCGKPADIFSMGATLYALLAGRPPFNAKSPMEVIMATVNKPHDPLPDLRPDASAATVAFVNRCLMKEAQHRFRDAESMLQALNLCKDVLAHPERQSKAVEEIRGAAPLPDAKKMEQPYFDELTLKAPTPMRRPEIEAEAGIAKLRANENRAKAMPMIAALVLAGFVGAGVAMLFMSSPEPKPEAKAPPVEPVALPKAAPPPPPAPVAATGPQSLGDKKFQDLQQAQLDRLNGVVHTMDKVDEKVKQAKIVEPILPISSIQDEEPGQSFFSAGRVMFAFITSIIGMVYMLYSRKSKSMSFGLCGALLSIMTWFIPWLSVGVMLAGVLISLPLFMAKR
ncbi:MAG: serine/threonine protein kinase [Planctomycetes bacterium]|nr:serine/threonine protein kinase [Planctomycetota bacterium]